MAHKVRFHLAKGKHFMHWQIRRDDGSVEYHDPATTVLVMFHTRLRNQKGTAEKIHNGANKTVCAWIDALIVGVYKKDEVPAAEMVNILEAEEEISFNPRVAPHWQDFKSNNIDGHNKNIVVSVDKKLFNVV